MASGAVDNGRTGGQNLWDLLARWNPAIGTLGAVIFQWFVPWFGLLIFAGILAQLNTIRHVYAFGDLSTAQASKLSREGIINSILMVLKMGSVVLGITLFLLILLAHVLYVPPRAKPYRPHSAWLFDHIGRVLFMFYRRHYDTVTVLLFVVLFGLLWLGPAQWHAMTALAGFGVVIPVYAIRHGTRIMFTYGVLLILLGMTLLTYPYRFGKDFYHFQYVLEVPLTSGPFRQLPLQLVAPGPGEGVTSFVSCDDRGNWVLKFPGVEKNDATPIERSTLSDLPFLCRDNMIIPSSYVPPTQ